MKHIKTTLIAMTMLCMTSCQSTKVIPPIECPIKPAWVKGEFGKWDNDRQECKEPGVNGGCWSTAHKRYISTVIENGVALGCWNEDENFTTGATNE